MFRAPCRFGSSGNLPLSDQLRFLVAESEPPQARETRRESVGRSSGETYIDTLRFLAPGAVCHRVKPADKGHHYLIEQSVRVIIRCS